MIIYAIQWAGPRKCQLVDVTAVEQWIALMLFYLTVILAKSTVYALNLLEIYYGKCMV